MMQSLKEVFQVESREQLQVLEDCLLQLERDPQDLDTVHTAFRAAHTVKGSSGMVDAHALGRFTHSVETVLDLIREGRVAAEPALITLLLAAADQMNRLLDCFSRGAAVDDDTAREGQRLIALLQPWCAIADADAGPAKTGGVVAAGDGTAASNPCWHVSLRPGAEIFLRGVDPLLLIRGMAELGTLVRAVTLDGALPKAAGMDAEQCYLDFEFDLQGDLTEDRIAEVFAFIRDESQLHIMAPHAPLSAYAAALHERAVSAPALLALWAGQGVLSADECARLQAPAPAAAAAAPGQGDGPPPAAAAGARSASAPRQDSGHLRVEASKLDQLMDQVGELVIASAGVHALAMRLRDAELVESVSLMSQRIQSLRESAMQMRMVQIGATFNRFQRVVRDVSMELGKDIELVIQGGETELDKSVVEKIGDPLMHLVRNSIDHGIEPVARRLAAGKPARGCLTMAARHESGGIVIEVRDDGGGLNTERIRAKAIEKKLVPASQALTEAEVHQLIFEPGFSTADQVTALSGRGVGMDVVRRNIQALRGSVNVHSRPGQGCVFTIRLPLTLAIIDGFRVLVGDAHFVIPLELVSECIQLEERQGFCQYMTLHGQMLPYVRLRGLFGLAPEAGGGPESVLVVRHEGRKVGLVVDRLHGEMQAVIKPLGVMFQGIQGLAGSILLGDGEIALFLDVPALLRRAALQEDAHAPPH